MFYEYYLIKYYFDKWLWEGNEGLRIIIKDEWWVVGGGFVNLRKEVQWQYYRDHQQLPDKIEPRNGG